MTVILDGKRIAAEIQEEIKVQISKAHAVGVQFHLTVILVGDDAASASYVRSKEKLANSLGIIGEIVRVSESIQQEALLKIVDTLNADSEIDGILVQLPLPKHIDEHEVLLRIDPDKDVDGFHPMNAGLNFLGYPNVWPCTPAGILEMLHRSKLSISGKHAVVVGRSNIVGKPMSLLLLNEHATVTICHSRTINLQAITSQADILISAVGKANFIQADHVKKDAIVIDVGMNRWNGKLVGDVDFEQVCSKCSAITPVPGGVGPLTVTMLMQNTVHLGKHRRHLVNQMN